jgi:hypothetical protein
MGFNFGEQKMEATWVNGNGDSGFCGLMPASDGYIRLRVDDNLRFNMSGPEQRPALNWQDVVSN